MPADYERISLSQKVERAEAKAAARGGRGAGLPKAAPRGGLESEAALPQREFRAPQPVARPVPRVGVPAADRPKGAA